MWTALSFALLISGILVEADDGGGGTGAQAETGDVPISQPQEFKWFASIGADCAGVKIGDRWVIAAAGCIPDSDSKPKPLTVGLECKNSQDCKKSTTPKHSITAMGPEGNRVRMVAFNQLVFLLLAENTLGAETNLQLNRLGSADAGKTVTTFKKAGGNKLKQVSATLQACTVTGTGICLPIGCADFQSGPVMDRSIVVGISAKTCNERNNGPHITTITEEVKTDFETAKVDGIGPNMKWYAEIKTDQGSCRGVKFRGREVLAEKKCVDEIKTSDDRRQKQFTLTFGRNCENPEKCKREGDPPSVTAKFHHIGKQFVVLLLDDRNDLGEAPLASFDSYVGENDKVKTPTNSDGKLTKVGHKDCAAGKARCLDLQCTADHYGAPLLRNGKVIGISAKDCAGENPKILKITKEFLKNYWITDTKRESEVQQPAAEVAERGHFKWYGAFENRNGKCHGAKIGRQLAIVDGNCIANKFEGDRTYFPAYFGLDCKGYRNRCRVQYGGPYSHQTSWVEKRDGEFSFMKFDDVERPVGAGSDIELATFDKTVTVGQRVTTTIYRRRGGQLKRIQVLTKKCKEDDDTRTCLAVDCKYHLTSTPVTFEYLGGGSVLVGISAEKCQKGDVGPQIRKITDAAITVSKALPKLVKQGQPLPWFGKFGTFTNQHGQCVAAKLGSWAIADAGCIEKNRELEQSGPKKGKKKGTIQAAFSFVDCTKPAKCNNKGRTTWFRSEVPKADHKTGGFAFMSIPDGVQTRFPENSDIGLASYDVNVDDGETVQIISHSQQLEAHPTNCKTDGSSVHTCLRIACHHPPSTLTHDGNLVGIHAGSCEDGETGPRIRKITSEVVEKLDELKKPATSGTDTQETEEEEEEEDEG